MASYDSRGLNYDINIYTGANLNLNLPETNHVSLK